jgi:sterol desaturase/sphingolipid hydroxylase (fatty acid hydroxylase superfamily)
VQPRLGSDVKTLGDAWRAWSAKRSPRILAAGLAVALTVRVLLGEWSWRDPAAAVVMLVVYVFGEWAIHVHLLHLPPFRWRGRMVELPTAASHRMHHEQPHDLNMIVFAPEEALALLVGAVPLVVGLGCLVVWPLAGAVPLATAMTAVAVAYVLILAYEWTHFLIHTAHRPRSRFYKAIWRNHRLHHYKNEHYWFSITTAGTSDRVLGTYPDQADVPTSRTAKNLHGEVA